MKLTSLAIRRPVVILMLFFALLVLGIKSRLDMSIDLYPKVDIPRVVITTIYPGAAPEEIETLVTKPIEDAVGSTSGIKNLTSASQEGMSIVVLEMELETNMDTAMSDVRAKVDAARMLIPKDANNPVIQKFDIGGLPILSLGLSSKRPVRELRQLADDVIKDRLGNIKGVAAVNVTGGDVREIQVNVDRRRLEAYGISIGQVTQALQSGNLNLPSGRITEGNRDYALRAVGEFSSPDEIRNLRISVGGGENGNDRVLTIGDIAEVKDSSAEREQESRLQGKDSIAIGIKKQSDANTVDVARAVKKQLQAMKTILPKDVNIAVSYDQSTKVEEALADVNVSLYLGALLAVLIVFLFLHNIRGTIIVAVAIPASMIATFVPIYFAGFTMNMMVMLGFSLAVGILVDDSIVVLENIYRHLHMGESPREAAINGRSEIGLAAVTITMVDVIVFLPIAFMGGIVGRFFREFGITVATATLFSLFVSFTLTPMLASRLYRKGETVEATKGFGFRFDQFYRGLDARYRLLLAWALRHRWQVIVGGWATLILIVVLVAGRLGFEFFPKGDQGLVTVSVEMPAGSSLAATNSVLKDVETIAERIPEIEYISTTAGSSAGMMGGQTGANYGQVSLTLTEKESVADRFWRLLHIGKQKRIREDQDIAIQLRKLTASIPGGRIMVTISTGMGGGASPVDIELQGDDTNELSRVAQEIKRIVAGTEGILNADVSWKVGKPEMRATVDRLRAADLGISTAEIALALRTSVAGNTDTKFRQNGKEYDIRVRLDQFDRHSLSDVGGLVVGSRDGTPIYLRDIAQISSDTGPTKIERKNRQRKVSVTADLEPGYPAGNIQGVLAKRLAGVDLGRVSLNWGGEFQEMKESGTNMMVALALSILLVYMLMAALFESFFSPLVIMFSLPMALVGAILALAISGETMSVISMIGIIMLMGLVTKNAILLVDYTNTLRERGKDRNEAILEAGPTRLRPILMTTFAMIFGMLPTAMKLGRGSEMRAPMAIAVIGGLIVSTMLTLVMVPVSYTVMDDLLKWIGKLGRRIFHRGGETPSQDPEPMPSEERETTADQV